jgi:hypothetical protein
MILTMDDAFLFHEAIGPYYLGIPSSFTFAVYGLLFISLIAFHWRVVVQSDFILLLMGVAFFGASILIDLGHDVLSFEFYASDFLEDGFKFLGIAGWLSYYATLSFKKLSETVRSKNVAEEEPIIPSKIMSQ